MEIIELTDNLSKFLLPFLPYLIKATEKASEEAGKQFGKMTWNKAKKAWQLLTLKSKRSNKTSLEIEPISSTPRSLDELKKLVEDSIKLNPEIQSKLSELVSSAIIQNFIKNVNVQNSQNISIGGDASGSVIITGNQNIVKK